MVKYDFKKWMSEQGFINGADSPQVIVEGCDGAGKSTVADWLCETIGHTITFHTSAPLKDANENYYFELLMAFNFCASRIHQPLIIDRFHIGELVYGSIFRPHNTSAGIEEKMYQMEESLNHRNTKVIYIYASPPNS